MVYIVFSHVLDGKVIHNKFECNWPCFVKPKPRGVPCGLEAISGQHLLQELVGQEASLFDVAHAFAYFQVHPTAYRYFP
jgi:hypothetical protein